MMYAEEFEKHLCNSMSFDTSVALKYLKQSNMSVSFYKLFSASTDVS